ncbi:hypothetical protein DI272_30315 [Streptomyces sp. Act143]|nr:hypothetical protein DI272_30315 [Streptomyces sp. Act143]
MVHLTPGPSHRRSTTAPVGAPGGRHGGRRGREAIDTWGRPIAQLTDDGPSPGLKKADRPRPGRSPAAQDDSARECGTPLGRCVVDCYDCALEDTATPAIAVCGRCGCGVCVQHACVLGQQVRRAAGTGLSYGRKPARRVTCRTCHEAEAFDHVLRGG